MSGSRNPSRGPLTGVRIVELGGVGPVPFAGMVLTGLGAEVIRVERPQARVSAGDTVLLRGRRSVAVDLKQPEGAAAVLRLVDSADALLEGFRPGVTERLRLGPEVCRARNPRLVYGRMTGWGQDGPLAEAPGHDINYIALTGVLHSIGAAGGDPVPPLNLIGDFGGGGMLLALGVVSALLHARATGSGQVVDAAMTDGSALLLAMTHGFLAGGQWSEGRGVNLFSGCAPFYTTYRCADGEHVAVGAIEPQFYAALVRELGLADDPVCGVQSRSPETWPTARQRFAEVFATRTRDAWAEHFAGTQACVTPVLSLTEAAAHPHNAARGTFLDGDGPLRPAPAPRFSATPGAAPGRLPEAGGDTRSVLAGAGLTDAELDRLSARGVIA
ncbi:CaiB/BaiF CoA transferase family protein [Streptomyces cavernicola]|uniref:CaiB/BaiF CoA-transferase family protein n=1 Tax=Streptomyces cavernicola TaxID=3043613 RepID=A0ABT6SG33_9ACTN|nr:CaiB/BaiF CoA-transferase family protein [Streptomyces sp. B-S-A6]MDI3406934.1 CaiB/BaiF CoA-transferase family protein [Streptomyces sp. B-S-A6]